MLDNNLPCLADIGCGYNYMYITVAQEMEEDGVNVYDLMTQHTTCQDRPL